jgi:hypothetical protein
VDGQIYIFTCEDGQITAAAPDGTASIEPGTVYMTLVNNCDANANLTYSTDYAIRWPLFGIFKR